MRCKEKSSWVRCLGYLVGFANLTKGNKMYKLDKGADSTQIYNNEETYIEVLKELTDIIKKQSK